MKIAALPDAVHPLGSLICQETFQVKFFAFVLFILLCLPGNLSGAFFIKYLTKYLPGDLPSEAFLEIPEKNQNVGSFLKNHSTQFDIITC